MASDDREARFIAFYRENYSLILTTCIRRLGNRASAEDAAAEVFRIAWQRFDENGDPTMAWLYVVARNIIGNEYRRVARFRALRDRIESTVMDSTRGDGGEVREAISQLRASERELLYMAYWEQLSGAEIADVLRISVPAVWTRLSRARGELRDVLMQQPSSHRLGDRG